MHAGHRRSSTWERERESLHFTAALSGRNSRESSTAQGTLKHITCLYICYSRRESRALFHYISQCSRGSLSSLRTRYLESFYTSLSFFFNFILFNSPFAQLRTHVVIVVSSLYCRFLNAGNSRFSSLHEGDVGRDREIKLGLYNLLYA